MTCLAVPYFVLWPVRLYHILFCGLSGCTIFCFVACLAVPYFVLWPVWLYHILFCGLSGSTIFCFVSCLAVPYFFILSHKRQDSLKTILLNIKCVSRYYPEDLAETFLTHEIIKRDIIININIIVRVVKSRRMRWTGHVARMGEGRGVHRVLVGRPEGKRPLGRPRRRWEDNIKMDLQEVEGGCEDWMELAQDSDRWWALVSTVMNFRVPKMRGIS